jgi:hypothetical protein
VPFSSKVDTGPDGCSKGGYFLMDSHFNEYSVSSMSLLSWGGVEMNKKLRASERDCQNNLSAFVTQES